MALSKLELMEMGRMLSKNPINVPNKFQAAHDALVAAWQSLTKEQKKKHRQDHAEIIKNKYSSFTTNDRLKAQLIASVDDEINNDYS